MINHDNVHNTVVFINILIIINCMFCMVKNNYTRLSDIYIIITILIISLYNVQGNYTVSIVGRGYRTRLKHKGGRLSTVSELFFEVGSQVIWTCGEWISLNKKIGLRFISYCVIIIIYRNSAIRNEKKRKKIKQSFVAKST